MQTIATPAGSLYDAGNRVIIRLVRREQVESTDGFAKYWLSVRSGLTPFFPRRARQVSERRVHVLPLSRTHQSSAVKWSHVFPPPRNS